MIADCLYFEKKEVLLQACPVFCHFESWEKWIEIVSLFSATLDGRNVEKMYKRYCGLYIPQDNTLMLCTSGIAVVVLFSAMHNDAGLRLTDI